MPSKSPTLNQILETYLEQFLRLFARFVAAYEQSVELERQRQRKQDASIRNQFSGNGSEPGYTNRSFKYGPVNARDAGIADWLNELIDDPTAQSPYADFFNIRGGANAGQTVTTGPDDLLSRLFRQKVTPEAFGGFDISDLITFGLGDDMIGSGGIIIDLRGAPPEVREAFKGFNTSVVKLPTTEEVLRRYEANDWNDYQIQIPMTALAISRGEEDHIPSHVRGKTRSVARILVGEYQKGTRHCCGSERCDIELVYLVLAAQEAATTKNSTPEAPATTEQAEPNEGKTEDGIRE